MAAQLNAILCVIEEELEGENKWSILFDTCAFDSVALSSLLMRHGFPSLLYYQKSGAYHCDACFDTESLLRGRYGILPSQSLTDNKAYVYALSLMRSDGYTEEVVHVPDIDAERILDQFLYMWKHVDAFKEASSLQD